MLHLLVVHLVQLRLTLAATLRERRRGDTGAMTTLEMVILCVGVAAIAALVLSGMGEAVTSRLDQLR